MRYKQEKQNYYHKAWHICLEIVFNSSSKRILFLQKMAVLPES